MLVNGLISLANMDQEKHIYLKILEKKIKKIRIIDVNDINNKTIDDLRLFDCLIIDNFKDHLNEEELFYSILHQSKQIENYIVITSIKTLNKSQLN